MDPLVKIILKDNDEELVYEMARQFFGHFNLQSWEDVTYGGRDYDYINDDYGFHTADGATKVVIIPEQAPFVIKIPFIGDESWDYGETQYFTGGCEYYEDEDRYDYCAEEAYIYEEARQLGCSRFFVPIVFFDTINGIPVYIQTKVEGLKKLARPSKEDTFKYASLKNSDQLDPDVGGCLMQYYTVEEVADFLQFVMDHSINDLEATRNGSYVPAFGRYVFWDYSGYRENY